MARPDYTDIVPRTTLNPGALTGAAGNPNLDPYRASQEDLSIEWYPDRDTAFTLALYNKDIKSFIVDVPVDRKSTRLNSSHSQISYAVFCLKKKKKLTHTCHY